MRIDYLIAGRFGRAAVLRPAMALWRNSDTDESAACLGVGRGHPASVDEMFRAYGFYRAVWTSVMTVALILLGVCGLAVKAISGTSHPSGVVVAVATMPWTFVMLTSMSLVSIGLLRDGPYFANARVGTNQRRPVESVAPRVGNADFWIALAVGLVAAGLVLGGILLAG